MRKHRAILQKGKADMILSNWSTLPTAANASRTQQYYVSDVGQGGSIWYSDGTRWRPVNSECTLFALTSDVVSSGASEQIHSQFSLPFSANNGSPWQNGDIITFEHDHNKSSTVETSTNKLRCGTAGTVADTDTGMFFIGLATSARQGRTSQAIRRVSATSIINASLGGTGTSFGTSSGASPAAVTVANIDSNTIFLSATVSMSVGVETDTLRTFIAKLITS